MISCVICNSLLSGKQKKYCSNKCKSRGAYRNNIELHKKKDRDRYHRDKELIVEKPCKQCGKKIPPLWAKDNLRKGAKHD